MTDPISGSWDNSFNFWNTPNVFGIALEYFQIIRKKRIDFLLEITAADIVYINNNIKNIKVHGCQ